MAAKRARCICVYYSFGKKHDRYCVRIWVPLGPVVGRREGVIREERQLLKLEYNIIIIINIYFISRLTSPAVDGTVLPS